MSSSSSAPSSAPLKDAVPEPRDASDDHDDDEEEYSVSSPYTEDFTVQPVSRIRDDTPSSKPQTEEEEEEEVAENGDLYVDEGNRSSKRKRALEFDNGAEQSEPPIKKGKGAVQRIWSLDDEIAVLEGMAEYWQTTGTDPCLHMLKFYEFIKTRLQNQVSMDQLSGKIRKMKGKFMGKDADWVSSNPHQQRLFELCKKVWDKGNSKSKNPSGGKKDDKGKVLKLNSSSDAGKSKLKRKVDVALPFGGKKDDKEEGVKLNSSISDAGKSKLKGKVGDNGEGVKLNSSSTDAGKSKLNGTVVVALPVQEASNTKQRETAKEQKVHPKAKEEKLKSDRRNEADSSKPALCWMNSVIEFSKKVGNGSFYPTLRDGMKLVPNSELEVINEKWGKIEVEAAELHLKRLELMRESSQVILEAFKSKRKR